MAINIEEIIAELEYSPQSSSKLSAYLPKLIVPGQEDRFWSSKEKIVVVDTSLFVQGYFQSNLWGSVAIELMHDLGASPVVLPDVARELQSLKASGRRDNYDMLIVDEEELEVDLFPKNLHLDLIVDHELKNKVVNMWKSTSSKYINYLRARKSGQTVDEPRLSSTDIRVMEVCLQRASRDLPTIVLSGDADITKTMRAFGHEGYSLEVYGQEPPPESGFREFLKDMDLLLTAEAIQAINACEPDKHYLLISKSESIVGNAKRELGFMVVDEPVKNESVYSAPIVSPDADDAQLRELLEHNRKVVIQSENHSNPDLRKNDFMLYNPRTHMIRDHKGYYKDVNVEQRLKSQGVPRRDFKIYYQMLEKIGNVVTMFPSPYSRVTDGYLFSHLPNLYTRVHELKLSVQK